jgi:hypothetical protein
MFLSRDSKLCLQPDKSVISRQSHYEVAITCCLVTMILRKQLCNLYDNYTETMHQLKNDECKTDIW